MLCFLLTLCAIIGTLQAARNSKELKLGERIEVRSVEEEATEIVFKGSLQESTILNVNWQEKGSPRIRVLSTSPNEVEYFVANNELIDDMFVPIVLTGYTSYKLILQGRFTFSLKYSKLSATDIYPNEPQLVLLPHNQTSTTLTLTPETANIPYNTSWYLEFRICHGYLSGYTLSRSTTEDYVLEQQRRVTITSQSTSTPFNATTRLYYLPIIFSEDNSTRSLIVELRGGKGYWEYIGILRVRLGKIIARDNLDMMEHRQTLPNIDNPFKQKDRRSGDYSTIVYKVGGDVGPAAAVKLVERSVCLFCLSILKGRVEFESQRYYTSSGEDVNRTIYEEKIFKGDFSQDIIQMHGANGNIVGDTELVKVVKRLKTNNGTWYTASPFLAGPTYPHAFLLQPNFTDPHQYSLPVPNPSSPASLIPTLTFLLSIIILCLLLSPADPPSPFPPSNTIMDIEVKGNSGIDDEKKII